MLMSRSRKLFEAGGLGGYIFLRINTNDGGQAQAPLPPPPPKICV